MNAPSPTMDSARPKVTVAHHFGFKGAERPISKRNDNASPARGEVPSCVVPKPHGPWVRGPEAALYLLASLFWSLFFLPAARTQAPLRGPWLQSARRRDVSIGHTGRLDISFTPSVSQVLLPLLRQNRAHPVCLHPCLFLSSLLVVTRYSCSFHRSRQRGGGRVVSQ